jgi:nicotinate-nucleotide pyrophosphorylase (carboxylating)
MESKIPFDFLPDYTLPNKSEVMKRIVNLVRIAYEEDVGTGDVTTNGTVDPNVMAVGSFLAKADGVVGGIHIAKLVFQMIDPELKAEFSHSDGDLVTNGTVFGTVQGCRRPLLVLIVADLCRTSTFFDPSRTVVLESHATYFWYCDADTSDGE